MSNPNSTMNQADPVVDAPPPPEAPAEGELFAAVSGIVAGLRRVHADAVAAYRPEVEDIIGRRSRDIDHIEHTLDGLLTFCGDEAALALFKRLCRYYWDLDPEATARQVLAYRDWFEPADEGVPAGALDQQG